MLELDEASRIDHSKCWNVVNNISHKSSQCNLDPQNICNEIAKLSKMPDQDNVDRLFEQECIKFLKKYDDGELKCKHNVLDMRRLIMQSGV